MKITGIMENIMFKTYTLVEVFISSELIALFLNFPGVQLIKFLNGNLICTCELKHRVYRAE